MSFLFCFFYIFVNVLPLAVGTDAGTTDEVSDLAKKRIIIDTDAGVDDAVAIFNFLGAEDLFKQIEIKLITAVHGNTNVDDVGRNVLKILKTAQRLDIPIYKGANESILLTPEVENFFGQDGFGDIEFPNPPSEDLIKKQNASIALAEAAALLPGELSLICLGPLTNVAMAIKLYPKFFDNLKEIFILGGSDSGVGNIKPGVEFNIYMDPEAAFIVFKEAEKKQMVLNVVTWEAALRSDIDMNWRKNVLGSIQSPAMDLLNRAEEMLLKEPKWISSDSILSALFLDPEMVELEQNFHVDLEVCGNFGRGAFFLDHESDDKRWKNARIIKKIKSDSYKNMLLTNLNSTGGRSSGAARTL